jgi:hypothetical protein
VAILVETFLLYITLYIRYDERPEYLDDTSQTLILYHSKFPFDGSCSLPATYRNMLRTILLKILM